MDNERDRDPQCVAHHQVILIFRIMASFEKVLLEGMIWFLSHVAVLTPF